MKNYFPRIQSCTCHADIFFFHFHNWISLTVVQKVTSDSCEPSSCADMLDEVCESATPCNRNADSEAEVLTVREWEEKSTSSQDW